MLLFLQCDFSAEVAIPFLIDDLTSHPSMQPCSKSVWRDWVHSLANSSSFLARPLISWTFTYSLGGVEDERELSGRATRARTGTTFGRGRTCRSGKLDPRSHRRPRPRLRESQSGKSFCAIAESWMSNRGQRRSACQPCTYGSKFADDQSVTWSWKGERGATHKGAKTAKAKGGPRCPRDQARDAYDR